MIRVNAVSGWALSDGQDDDLNHPDWRFLSGSEVDDDEDVRRSDVRLECDGSFVGARAVQATAVESFAGVALMRFVCPRCGEGHESLVLA